VYDVEPDFVYDVEPGPQMNEFKEMDHDEDLEIYPLDLSSWTSNIPQSSRTLEFRLLPTTL
jgi:hypothetical protein